MRGRRFVLGWVSCISLSHPVSLYPPLSPVLCAPSLSGRHFLLCGILLPIPICWGLGRTGHPQLPSPAPLLRSSIQPLLLHHHCTFRHGGGLGHGICLRAHLCAHRLPLDWFGMKEVTRLLHMDSPSPTFPKHSCLLLLH